MRKPEITLEHPLVVTLLDVRFFSGAARIGRHIRDARSIRRPRIRRDALLGIGQLPRFTALDRHHVDLRLGFRIAACRYEADGLAVGRKLRLALALLTESDL